MPLFSTQKIVKGALILFILTVVTSVLLIPFGKITTLPQFLIDVGIVYIIMISFVAFVTFTVRFINRVFNWLESDNW